MQTSRPLQRIDWGTTITTGRRQLNPAEEPEPPLSNTVNAKSMKVDDGLDSGTQMGPLANSRRTSAMQDLISDAVKKGATLLAGGKPIGNKGYYWPLTVPRNVPDHARIINEVPFGPVALVNRIRSLDEAVTRANSLQYGLSGYALTHSKDNVAYLTNDLQVGNLATTSVRPFPKRLLAESKSRTMGREGGIEGLRKYTITRSISHLMNALRYLNHFRAERMMLKQCQL